MRSFRQKLIPAWLDVAVRRFRSQRSVRQEFNKDARRFNQHALSHIRLAPKTPTHVEALTTLEYHRVEKAFALPDPKRPFGSDVSMRLNRLLDQAAEQDLEGSFINHARSAQIALREWNEGDGGVSDEVAPPFVRPTFAEVPGDFFSSRRSVRNFSSREVPEDLLRLAIERASAAPSVCNRAPWKVWLLREQDAQRALSHQNGNRGFGHQVPVLALVAVDLQYFQGPIERFQPWIEGGIFSASFVWALHSLGLQSCMLNLSQVTAQADALRNEVGMSDSCVPIAMIAIGFGAEDARTARSARRSVAEILVTGQREAGTHAV